MRILILFIGLVASISVTAQAGEHPAATIEHPVAAVKQADGADAAVEGLRSSGLLKDEDTAFVSAQIQRLVEKGVPLAEAVKLFTDALTESQVEGLTGEALERRINEVAQAAMSQVNTLKSAAEHPAVGKPATGKPKDHPAH